MCSFVSVVYCCLLLVVCNGSSLFLLFVVRWLLFVACLGVDCCAVFAVYCVLFAACCLLFTVCSVLFADRCSSRVVPCLLFANWY